MKDDANIKLKVEAIQTLNNFLKMIDDAVEVVHKYHPRRKSIIGFSTTHIFLRTSGRKCFRDSGSSGGKIPDSGADKPDNIFSVEK